jgi:hypothetical protein
MYHRIVHVRSCDGNLELNKQVVPAAMKLLVNQLCTPYEGRGDQQYKLCTGSFEAVFRILPCCYHTLHVMKQLNSKLKVDMSSFHSHWHFEPASEQPKKVVKALSSHNLHYIHRTPRPFYIYWHLTRL